MEKNSLRLHFGGESHSIDANTLLNALIHCNNLLNLINSEYGGGSKEIRIQVNAPKKGSFILDLSVVEGAIKSLFSKDSVNYIADILCVLGGIFTIYKVFKGKPTDSETVKTQTNIQVNNVHIFNTILTVYNDRRSREAVSKSFETLNSDDSIESFDLVTHKETISIPRSDFADMIYRDFDEEDLTVEEKVSEEDAILIIVALNFEKGATWTFIHRGNRFRMQVKDDALMDQIDKGMQFGKGDAIKVKIQVTKRFNPEYRAYEISSRRIIEFYELIKRDYKDPILIDEQ